MKAEATLYETDFVEWTTRTAQLLREGRFDELDIRHLAEEVEDIGKSERRELENRLTVLLSHLLKWQFQTERRGRSWKSTITTQRNAVARILRDAPSLKSYLAATLSDCYCDDRKLAAADTELPSDSFPSICPYKLAQILDTEYFP